MILHDFTYEWDGKSRSGEKPITWFPGAYRVRIIRLGEDGDGIRFMFPTAVLLKPVLKKDVRFQSLKNYIHNFAEALARDYALNVHKTLWVEVRESIRIAHLNPDHKLSGKPLFSYSWRDAHPKELALLAPYTENF